MKTDDQTSEDAAGDNMRPGRWFRDLRRRKVFRVMAAYGVVAWLILQATDILTGAFPFPNWTVAAMTVVLALGFPIAAALSWAFQVTPEGVVLDLAEARPLSKNRSRLIHSLDVIVICSLLIVVAYLSLGDTFTRTSSGQTRVAVLPFENLSNDQSVTYLSEGIADDIRARLYDVPQLLLAARSSSASIFGKGLDIQTIGERLTVEHVLEGTIRKSDDRIRVTVQLVDTNSGIARWVKTYDTRLDDVLEMQTNISLAVTSQLEVLLSKDVRQTLSRNPTDDPVAYDYYLQAENYINRPRTETNLDLASSLYSQAIDRDPRFALGYAGLCKVAIGRYRETSDTAHIDNAVSNCQQALGLDPSLSEVHTALGKMYVSLSQWDQAEFAFQKAIDLDPRDVEAFAGMADVFAARERYVEAEERLNTAIDLLPANWIGYSRLAHFLIQRGRFEEAVANYRRVVEFTPDNPGAFNDLGVAYFLMGDFENAAVSFRQSLELEPRRSAYSNTAYMSYLAGDIEQAVQFFEKATREADDDYKLWGNLADAQRFVEGLDAAAQLSYEKAIELAQLEINASAAEGEDLTNLAWYHVNLGNFEIAERYLESAASMPNRTAEQFYVEALVHSLLGNAEPAEAAILEAKERGISQAILDATPELQGRLSGATRLQEQGE